MRWVTALFALAACGDDGPEVFDEPRTIDLTFPSVPNRKLDLLLMVDDSASVDAFQTDVSIAMQSVLDDLRAVSGSLPDLHVGIITSDLGTMGSLDPANPGPAIGQVGNGGCAGAGDDGRLQTFGVGVTGAFLIDEDDGVGGRIRNYQTDTADTIAQMIRGAGAGGCGFEQPLHAIRRGLLHPANQGFIRADAHLGVFILADEDDCSFLDPKLLTTDTSGLGPLQSFRCSEHGVVCDQPLTHVGPKTGCRPREDSVYVEGIETTRALLRSVKPSPADLSFFALIGDPTPFAVELRSPPGGGVGERALAHSCSYTGTSGLNVADPGVRITALANAFGGRGATTSLCAIFASKRVDELTRLLKHPLGVVCLDTRRLTITSTDQGLQPACELTEIIGDVETRLTDFEITADAAACPETTDHLRLVVRGTSTAPGAYVRARCETPY